MSGVNKQASIWWRGGVKILYSWLKEFLPTLSRAVRTPEELAERLTNCGLEVAKIITVDKETVFELEITTNRADCLNHLGVAREIAAILGIPLKLPLVNFRRFSIPVSPVKIKIEKPYFCYRYYAQIITNLKISQSPEWLSKRLSLCDIRPINNLIDITNYVLLELGQPLHAFDYQSLSDKQIIVRWAKDKEKILTLDNQERTLDEEIPVIADTEKTVALAGIIGGEQTGVKEDTNTILLESAYFDARTIRKAAKKLGITTESSYRFERGVDWQNISFASNRVAYLLQKLCQGKVLKQKVDLRVRDYVPVKLSLPFSQVNNLLGTELSSREIINYLCKLHFLIGNKTADKITVKVPSYRNDILHQVDLIEEIARVYNYQNIPAEINYFRPNKLDIVEEKRITKLEDKTRQILVSCGLNEVINYSFISTHALEELNLVPQDYTSKIIQLRNPISVENAFMRITLLSGLLRNLSHNLRRQVANIKIFELGKIFFTEKGSIIERHHLAGLLTGQDNISHWTEKLKLIDFYSFTGLLDTLLERLGLKNYQYTKFSLPYLKPEKSFRLQVGKDILGEFGELHPKITEKYDLLPIYFGTQQKVYLFEINLENLSSYIQLERRYHPLPKYPFVQRDLSFIIREDNTYAQIKNLILNTAGQHLYRCDLFDIYKGETIPPGYRSLTCRLTYYNPQSTFTHDEIEDIQQKIVTVLEKELSAKVRKI